MHTAFSSQQCASVKWIVLPETTPNVLRPCGRCNRIQPFYCTEKFRINGHQQRLDAWLIYNCQQCDHTWNLSIFTRARPGQIGHDVLVRMEANDRELAHMYAFDLPRIKQTGARVEADVSYRVTEHLLESPADWAGSVSFLVEVPAPISVRVEQLLQKQWQVPRSKIRQWHQDGLVVIEGSSRKVLRKSIQDGQFIQLQLCEETHHVFQHLAKLPGYDESGKKMVKVVP